MAPLHPILNLLQDSHDPALSAPDIEELEIAIGKRFPKEYADFLQQFNGGCFRLPVMFYAHHPTSWMNEVDVDGFYGEPNDGIESRGLVWRSDWFTDRLPDDYLAFAHCSGQNLILLKLVGAESKFEGVWLYDSIGFWNAEDGNTLHWLADSFYEFLSMLVVDIENIPDPCETMPIFVEIERGNLRAVEKYLAEGRSIESHNEEGKTLLATAADYSWPKIVELLLSLGADPNARDTLGRITLHHAATSSIDSVKLLLAAGADAKAREMAGKSVLAEWSYRADQILRAHGATE